MEEIKGSVQVSTENIFPIIRQWLYTDKDIFIREIISNAADAITKLEHLRELGEFKQEDKPDYKINVYYDSENNTITVEDNGIGMNAAEINQYINEIAYSGAVKFIENYSDKNVAGGVIGHFGLGFYSSFIVSQKVRIESLSYLEGSKGCYWESTDGMNYTMGDLDKNDRGTKVIMYLSAEAAKEINSARLYSAMFKYCEFMPYPIYFVDLVSRKKEQADVDARNKSKREEAIKNGESPAEEEKISELRPLNNTKPLWLKDPKECEKQEYIDFYHECFHDMKEPLFWIHLNMEYPIRLKGILYFPKEEKYQDDLSSRIKVYYNQVFVADDVKELLPEYLFLLKGCIDSPDLPLNVSRSALQNNSTLAKVRDYIARKVADKLVNLCKEDKKQYSKYWENISTFVKYGSMRDEKFYERVKPAILLETVEAEFFTLDELLALSKNDQADKAETSKTEVSVENSEVSSETSSGTSSQAAENANAKTDNNAEEAVDAETAETETKNYEVYYTVNPAQQVKYINIWKQAGEKVYKLDQDIDFSFESFLDYKLENITFIRVDAKLPGEHESTDDWTVLSDLFKGIVKDDNVEIIFQARGEGDSAATLLEDEESRKTREMQKLYLTMQGEDTDESLLMPVKKQLILNSGSALIKNLADSAAVEVTEQDKNVAKEIYDLARLSHGSLQGEEFSEFLARTEELLASNN